MSRKKILFLVDCLDGGGAQRAIVNTVNNFESDDDYKIYLIVLDDSGPLKGYLKKSVNLENLSAKSAKKGLFKLVKKIREIKPDVLVSTPAYISELAYLATRFMNKKPALIMRSATMESINMKEESFLVDLLIKKAYKSSSAVIALTEEMKKDLIDEYDVEQDKIYVVPNMVDIEVIRQKMNKKVKEVSLFENKNIPVIITVGRLVEVKGYKYLLKAFKEYLHEHRARLIIIGDGPLKDELETHINRLGIKRQVHLLGFRANPYKYISKADIFILSSLWEGFPNALIEAMVCGTPVISTNCSSGPGEIITSGLDGILVPVKDIKEMSDAIGRLVENRNFRLDLIENAFNTVSKYKPENIVSRYKEIFRTITEATVKEQERTVEKDSNKIYEE